MFRWWLHDPRLPIWNFDPSRQDRFHPMITRRIKFHPGKARQFSTWYLDRFVYIFFFYTFSSCLYRLMRLHGKILSRQSGISAVQKKDPASTGRNCSHVIVRYDLWRVCSSAGISTKRNKISSQPSVIM